MKTVLIASGVLGAVFLAVSLRSLMAWKGRQRERKQSEERRFRQTLGAQRVVGQHIYERLDRLVKQQGINLEVSSSEAESPGHSIYTVFATRFVRLGIMEGHDIREGVELDVDMFFGPGRPWGRPIEVSRSNQPFAELWPADDQNLELLIQSLEQHILEHFAGAKV